MSIELPRIIADYFEADRNGNPGAVAKLFTEEAVVRDEGHTYSGQDAIRRWKADASKKYTYTVEPFAIATSAGRTIVTSHVVGDFPGSPVDLRYFFVLEDNGIANLEIVL
jgi:ketosteroid isomerase-like protein